MPCNNGWNGANGKASNTWKPWKPCLYVLHTIPLIPLQPLPQAHPPQLRCHQPPVLYATKLPEVIKAVSWLGSLMVRQSHG
jgi:hypothetical protein